MLTEHKLTSAELQVENMLHVYGQMPPTEVREGQHIPKLIKMKELESSLVRQEACLTV